MDATRQKRPLSDIDNTPLVNVTPEKHERHEGRDRRERRHEQENKKHKRDKQERRERKENKSPEPVRDLRQLFKEGQKYLTPPAADPTRAFYQSLLEENENSSMAVNYCVEYGVLPLAEHRRMLRKYLWLKRKERQRLLSKAGSGLRGV